jgi:hypothetical protein
MKKRTLSESKKKQVVGKQYYKCANNPNTKINGLENYDCML